MLHTSSNINPHNLAQVNVYLKPTKKTMIDMIQNKRSSFCHRKVNQNMLFNRTHLFKGTINLKYFRLRVNN